MAGATTAFNCYANGVTSFTTALILNDSSQTLNNSKQTSKLSDLWHPRHGAHAGVSQFIQGLTGHCFKTQNLKSGDRR